MAFPRLPVVLTAGVGRTATIRDARALVAADALLLTTGPALADQAYAVLRDVIASGELEPAQRLTARRLTQQSGVSPSRVREAISRLAHERLLVRVGSRTLQVAAPSLCRAA